MAAVPSSRISGKKPVSRLFSITDTLKGVFLFLPQYDVSSVDEETCEKIAKAEGRLRIPKYLSYLKGICEGDLRVIRIAMLYGENGKRVAVALDEAIRRNLRMVGAVAIPEPYVHKVVSGS